MNAHPEPRYPLHTLTKATEILRYISENAGEQGVTLNNISKSLNISKSSAHRILDTLLYLGYTDKTAGPIVYYRLGWQLYNIGRSVPFMHSLQPSCYEEPLLQLSAELNRQLSLFTEKESLAVPLFEARLGDRVPPGGIFNSSLPLYASAPGKLFMSNCNEEEIRLYFQTADIRKYTSGTILNYIEFLEELGRVSELGYAEDKQEYRQNYFNTAFPVRNYTGRVIAAVSVASQSLPDEEELDRLKEKMIPFCFSLSEYLGFSASRKDAANPLTV